MAYSCFSYSNKQFKTYYKCQKDMGVLSLYYPARANKKYHRNSATSLHLGECDGCVCRILKQRLPRGLPWSVMLDWWYGCRCKLFAAASQHRRCVLPGFWSCLCCMNWRQIKHQRLESFGHLFHDSALLHNTGQCKLQHFWSAINTVKWQSKNSSVVSTVHSTYFRIMQNQICRITHIPRPPSYYPKFDRLHCYHSLYRSMRFKFFHSCSSHDTQWEMLVLQV